MSVMITKKRQTGVKTLLWSYLGFSLVEVVGIRKINDDHFVHEVRLPVGEAAVGQDEATDADGNVPKYVTNGINFMFTGQGPIENCIRGG